MALWNFINHYFYKFDAITSFQTMMQKFYENEYAQYVLVDHIVHITYKKGVMIDLRAAQMIVKDRFMFQEERAYPILCDIRHLRRVDKPARDYLALEGSLLISAIAFIFEPPVTDAMTQFYLKTNHSKIPTAKFGDKSKAIAYLRSFLEIILFLVPCDQILNSTILSTLINNI